MEDMAIPITSADAWYSFLRRMGKNVRYDPYRITNTRILVKKRPQTVFRLMVFHTFLKYDPKEAVFITGTFCIENHTIRATGMAREGKMNTNRQFMVAKIPPRAG
jgi:hypothetical protein